MKKISKPEVLNLVESFDDKGQLWHYHFLTPTCQFNESDQYALLVENIDAKKSYVYYSDIAEMELSSKLANKLHGKDVMDQSKTKKGYLPGVNVLSILDLIQILKAEKIKWHHHVFFPGCKFNIHTDKFELVVEDPRNNKCLISLSDDEPIEDLKQIETEFYNQKI